MRERKITGVHGTLEMIPLAWKFNSKQLLSKTLNSRTDIIEIRAVLNIVKTDGKWSPEGIIKLLLYRLFSRIKGLKATAIGTGFI